MRVRPHHLLCIQKFTGHGYDERFTAHMTDLVRRLRERPDTEIVLTRGCDALCGMCPHAVDGACDAKEKTARMDDALLACCALAYGERLPWREAAERARRLVLARGRTQDVCAGCQWYALCAKTEV